MRECTAKLQAANLYTRFPDVFNEYRYSALNRLGQTDHPPMMTTEVEVLRSFAGTSDGLQITADNFSRLEVRDSAVVLPI